MSTKIDHEYTDTVICPYCGYDNGGDDGDGPPTGATQCYNEDCEKNFDVEPNYSVSYTTRKVPCLNGEPHDFRVDPYVFYRAEGQPGFQIRNCWACSKSEHIPYVPKPKEID